MNHGPGEEAPRRLVQEVGASQDLGQRLRHARHGRGLSLSETAGRQLTATALSRIERGGVRPAPATLLHLVDRLQLDLGETVVAWLMSSPREADRWAIVPRLRAQGRWDLVVSVLSTLSPNARQSATGLHEQALLLEAAGDLEGAAEVYREASEKASQAGDWDRRGEVNLRLGGTYRSMGRPRTALSYFSRALQDLRNSEAIFVAKQQSAAAKLEWGALQWALADYDQLLLHATKSDGRYPDLLSGKAFAVNALGAPQDALLLNRTALKHFSQQDNRRRIADTLNNMSVCFKHLGRYDDGIAASIESVRLREGNLLSIYSLVELAEISLRLGNRAGAERYIAQTRDLIDRDHLYHEELVAIVVLEGALYGDSSTRLEACLTEATVGPSAICERSLVQLRRGLETAIGLHLTTVAAHIMGHVAHMDATVSGRDG